ncbi:hypothetical protein BJ165DRAFT_267788 [Panaeolus papilionaceus]|nr:hypothetical protein BJ165DRAFT_267788 [Panaeolus papilionaceus]
MAVFMFPSPLAFHPLLVFLRLFPYFIVSSLDTLYQLHASSLFRLDQFCSLNFVFESCFCFFPSQQSYQLLSGQVSSHFVGFPDSQRHQLYLVLFLLSFQSSCSCAT